MATVTLRPNAAGDETSINSQTPSSGYHWDKVDEESADDGSTCVYTLSMSYKRDLYNIPNPTASGTINSITIYFRCSSGESSNYAKPSLKVDSTVVDGTEKVFSSWATKSQTWTTNPVDGEAWEWSDIDNLQIGVSLMGGLVVPFFCTQVYV
jgi:uncharacterized protein (UPF0333 family)